MLVIPIPVPNERSLCGKQVIKNCCSINRSLPIVILPQTKLILLRIFANPHRVYPTQSRVQLANPLPILTRIFCARSTPTKYSLIMDIICLGWKYYLDAKVCFFVEGKIQRAARNLHC